MAELSGCLNDIVLYTVLLQTVPLCTRFSTAVGLSKTMGSWNNVYVVRWSIGVGSCGMRQMIEAGWHFVGRPG